MCTKIGSSGDCTAHVLCRGKLIWRHEDHALWTESFLLANPVGQWYSLSPLLPAMLIRAVEQAACQLGAMQKQVI